MSKKIKQFLKENNVFFNFKCNNCLKIFKACLGDDCPHCESNDVTIQIED